jgi:ribosomal protein S4
VPVDAPRSERTVTVDETAAGRGVRLDAFVHAALPASSRRLVHGLIEEGAVRVNGRRATKGLPLRPRDRVTVPELPTGLAPEPTLAVRVVTRTTRSWRS